MTAAVELIAADVTPPASSGWTDPHNLSKVCPACGEAFGRNRYPNGRLESPKEFSRRRFCSQACVRPGRPARGRPAGSRSAAPVVQPPRLGSRSGLLAGVLSGGEWEYRSACRGEDPELFFGQENERPPVRDRREVVALAICATCPVAAECLEFAMSSGQQFGVWGGLSEDDVRKELRRRARSRMNAA